MKPNILQRLARFIIYIPLWPIWFTDYLDGYPLSTWSYLRFEAFTVIPFCIIIFPANLIRFICTDRFLKFLFGPGVL